MFEEEGDYEGETEQNLKIHFSSFGRVRGDETFQINHRLLNYPLILDVVESN